MRFVDTNVLLYSISRDPAEERKAERARAILREPDLALSVQVLQEFYVQSTRETRADPLTHEDAVALIRSFGRYPVQDVSVKTMTMALELRERYEISYWDAAIVASARRAGCEVLLSEDLSHGQEYSGVRVENPFLPTDDDG